MKNESLYNKTVDILVQAYFADELISQDCTACACGNLIMANNGYKRVEMGEDSFWMNKHGRYLNPKWNDAVFTPSKRWFRPQEQKVILSQYKEDVRSEVESTGYKLHEFAAIEFAFERGYRGKDKMFNALMNVIEALDKIHENTDTEVTNISKKKFDKVLTS